jgi:biopolymer transport protein ExbD
MTAMVDVTFFLLIFFMVTSMHSMQASLEMPPPDASANAAQGQTIQQLDEDDDSVVVRVDRDSVIWVEGSEAPSRQDLIAKLRDAREGPGAVSKMVVMANGDALHGKVVEALDAGMDVGMASVSLATVEED